jgi:hypothetical protein
MAPLTLPPGSMTWSANLPLVSTTSAENFAINFPSVVDTGDKFAINVNDTDGKFATCVNDTWQTMGPTIRLLTT